MGTQNPKSFIQVFQQNENLLTKKRNSLAPIGRNYDYQKSFNITKLKAELGMPTPTSHHILPKSPVRRKSHLQYFKIKFIDEKLQQDKEDKSLTLHKIRELKREIFFKRMSITDKQINLKDLEHKTLYQEKQLLFKMKDFKDNTIIIKENLERKNQQVEKLMKRVGLQEEFHQQISKKVEKVKDRVYQKEIEINALEQRIIDYQKYKDLAEAIMNIEPYGAHDLMDKLRSETLLSSKTELADMAFDGLMTEVKGRTWEAISQAPKSLFITNVPPSFSNFCPIFQNSTPPEAGRLEKLEYLFKCRLESLEENSHLIFEDTLLLEDKMHKINEYLEKPMAEASQSLQEIIKRRNELAQLEEELIKKKAKLEKILENSKKKVATPNTSPFDISAIPDQKLPTNTSQNWHPNQTNLEKLSEFCSKMLLNIGYENSHTLVLMDQLKLIEFYMELYGTQAKIIKKMGRDFHALATKEFRNLTRSEGKPLAVHQNRDRLRLAQITKMATSGQVPKQLVRAPMTKVFLKSTHENANPNRLNLKQTDTENCYFS